MDKLTEFKLVDTDRRAMLLVEGVQDALFCEAVLEYLDLFDRVQIVEAGGRPKIPVALQDIARSRAVRLNILLKLGILQDADRSAEKSQSNVVGALQTAGLPVPSKCPTPENADTPVVSIFITPDNRSQGSLEDLCLSSLTTDKVQHLNEHIERVNQCEPRLRPILFPK